MKHSLLIASVALLLHAATPALAAHAVPAAPARDTVTACWLETAASTMDGAMGGNGLRHTKVWHSTISSVLVHHPKGDVLIDTGFSRHAEAQMGELPDAARAFGLQIVGAARSRTTITDALAGVGEPPAAVARILITHAHYDHLGGATELTAPIYVAPAEATWLAAQATHPTITPPSLVAAVRPRLKTLAYRSGPYLGFDASDDLYGDGSIVTVPLPGHTPGSQGVFLTLGKRRVFLIGDAADTLEAADRGLPKNAVIRANTDTDPALADATSRHLAAFHRAHPEIALVPAHDRDAFVRAFGQPARCIANFPSTQGVRHDP